MLGYVFSLFLLGLVAVSTTSFAALLNPESCNYRAEALALGDAAHELHGGMPLHPEPRTMLSKFLRKHRVAYGVRKFSLVDNPNVSKMKLVIAIGPNEFNEFITTFSKEFPHLVQNVHAPDTESYNHLMFRGADFTRQSGSDFRFPAEGTIAPALLLSSSEAARLHEFLFLVQNYGSNIVYPWTIPGYGYPADPYHNCGSWPPHIPIGDATSSVVKVSKWVDGRGAGRQAARTGTLTAPPIPAYIRPEHRALYARVWSAPVHERLWDVLEMSWEKGDGSSTSNFAQSLSVLASNDRVPFIVYYTQNPKELPSPFDAQFHEW